jgi:hypothetical protein
MDKQNQQLDAQYEISGILYFGSYTIHFLEPDNVGYECPNCKFYKQENRIFLESVEPEKPFLLN